MKKIRLLFLAIAFLFTGFSALNAQDIVEDQIIESLEFREVDIKDVLRQLAKQYELNIVFSEGVKGLVTVQLTNISVRQALDSIITVNGFAYTKKENVYRVATQEESAREGRQSKLFQLNNAEAIKLKDTLAKVLSVEGTIEADARSNSVLVTDTLAVINKIEQMVPVLDQITAQVLIEAKLIETSLTNTESLGIEWNTTILAAGASRKTSLPFEPTGTENWYSNIFPPANTSDGNFSHGNKLGFPFVDTSQFTFGTLDFSSFAAVLKFLKSRTNTKLIANPRIVTLNNQKAKIHVGRVIPIATYEMDSTTGSWRITGWVNQTVGVNLEVTPQVSPDGHIRLKLKPEVSSSSSGIGTGENYRPIITTRTADTEVQIKSGQTVVIAGLVKNRDEVTVTKIPILGDLPIIGNLFKRINRGIGEPTEKTDLLIFVTARIIKDTAEPMLAYDTNILSAPPRPFKLKAR
ncbi:MAG: hypothetical protein KKE64_04000 [Candidatus Omnitrophica bacterium]|nr:hypothetical protein [Candidatus Omnitrophota bacterium]